MLVVMRVAARMAVHVVMCMATLVVRCTSMLVAVWQCLRRCVRQCAVGALLLESTEHALFGANHSCKPVSGKSAAHGPP
eukprot:7972676-Alexandrium_andersonii.AAC.1